MRMIKHALLAGAIGVAAIASVTQGSADALWPRRTVRLIVPFGPGSATDIAGRLYADRLSKRWGQPVIVENRPGGDFIIGVSAFLGSHDDHSLLLATVSPITVNPLLKETLPYDPAELAPISLATEVSVAIAVPAGLKAQNLNELIALARARPGELNWAATPGGTYLTFAGFQKNANLPIANVPYRDIVQAQNDLSAGRIHIMICATAIVLPQVNSGKLRLIAVTNRQRAGIIPDVPTATEAGHPELRLEGPVGFFATRSLPREILLKISADVRSVAADPELAARLFNTGQTVSGSMPEEFGAMIEAQRARMVELVEAVGAKPDR
jgi:tripartite-type tricarboxylate transporter receptor subunit TctC